MSIITEKPPTVKTEELDYRDVLYRHFLAMCDALVADDEPTAAAYAEQWRRVWSEHIDGQEQRAEIYAQYQNAIKAQLPDLIQWRAYSLLGIAPEVPDLADSLGRVFDIEADGNGRDPAIDHMTDMGNAARMVRWHGADLRYCYAWGKWLVWDGTRWATDETGEIDRRAKDTVRRIYAEAGKIADDEKRKEFARWAIRNESQSRRDAMIRSARSEPGMPVEPHHLDRDNWTLNLRNGLLDLRTGELQDHDRAGLVTKLAPVNYDAGAQCPTWLAFLDRSLDGNEDLIRFIQRAIGYSLTGDTSEQCLFILYGTGANGKTTFLQAVSGLLGDYAQQTQADTFLIKRNDVISNDVARLKGARLVTAAEADEGRKLAEALVKQMTGNDKITARFLYAEPFEFVPTFKIFLGTNHKPQIRGTDHAIWRRIRLIPFTVTIPDEEQDKNLPAKLEAERAGILAWAVRGCLDWQREGLTMPEAVRAATDAYRSDMDVMRRFLNECTYEPKADDPNGDLVKTRGGELYKAYKSWCEDSGESYVTATAFGLRMKELGYEKSDPKATRYVLYLRLGLLATDE